MIGDKKGSPVKDFPKILGDTVWLKTILVKDINSSERAAATRPAGQTGLDQHIVASGIQKLDGDEESDKLGDKLEDEPEEEGQVSPFLPFLEQAK